MILYGNADSNGAWKALLGESPVRVKRGVIQVGERKEDEYQEDGECRRLGPEEGARPLRYLEPHGLDSPSEELGRRVVGDGGDENVD